AERRAGEVRGLVLVDAAAAGTRVGSFERLQAHVVNFLQLPVIHQIADATFGQLLDTVTVDMTDGKAFHPQPIASAHRHRVLAINMTKGNLEAYGGEELAANGVIERVDKQLGTIEVPAVVIQGTSDELIEPIHGRKLAAALPHASLRLVRGGHMAPYTHPAAIAEAVQSLAGPASRATGQAAALTPRRPARIAA
ncbi:MAG TPA: alpha/beta hydrolase, partial [Solirubrobacteraceae bacterium]